jgi:hypothetical protein
MTQMRSASSFGSGNYIPAIPQIRIEPDRIPRLMGVRCVNCGQTYLNAKSACPRCFSRKPMDEVELATHGKLYSYTIVHRSFPGVPTPFVMAVIDMDDGLTLSGTLIEVEPKSEDIPFDLPVRLAFQDSGQIAPDGRHYLTYVFLPEGSAYGG